MTERPQVRTVVQLPPRERGNPWPWVAFAFAAGFWGWMLVRADTGPDPTPPATIAAPQAYEVTRIVVQTPTATRTPPFTPTARIVIATVTATPTEAVPPCSRAEGGTVCIQYPLTAIPTPLVACDKLTPSPFLTQVCVKEDAGTSAKGETG